MTTREGLLVAGTALALAAMGLLSLLRAIGADVDAAARESAGEPSPTGCVAPPPVRAPSYTPLNARPAVAMPRRPVTP